MTYSVLKVPLNPNQPTDCARVTTSVFFVDDDEN